MKKTFIAICLSASVFSVNATEPNSFYVGLKSGGSSVHHGVSQFKPQGSTADLNRISVAYGAFAGYQITPTWAAELGYERFGQLSVDKLGGDSLFKHTAQGAQLGLKGIYPLTENVAVFAKLGTAFVNNRYRFDELGVEGKTKSNKLSPLVAAGIDYSLLPELGFRVEYQWVGKTGKSNALEQLNTKSKYSPDIHALTVGLVYKFGQVAKSVEVDKSTQVSKNFEFDTDVLFDFAQSNLKTQAMETLDKVYTDISALELSQTNVYVNGYTDRIGSDSFNLALSQKRADNVANYMVGKGLDSQSVTAIGHGKAYSATGSQCDNITNQKDLVTCLAPDRRVTLQVKGIK